MLRKLASVFIGLSTIAAASALAQSPAAALSTPTSAPTPSASLAASPIAAATAPATVTVDVNLSRSMGTFPPVANWFGFDESNYASMPFGRQLLGELHDLSPAPIYIRSHHLLTSGNGVPELKWSSSNVFRIGPDGKPIYDFTITDRTFDAYQQAGVRPMVELGFMPQDLAATVPGITEYQLHHPRPTMAGSVNNPPRDYALWRELIHTYVAHLVSRYGADEVRTWPFEVWNEPDIIYWHGTTAEYLKLYDYTVDGVLSALPGARVGGPATTGPASPKAAAYLHAFLDHCLNDPSAANGKPVPLDFISFHPKGKTRMVDGHLQMGLATELQSVEAGFQIVASYPRFRQLPIILSEADPEGCAACSVKDNPANIYRNSSQYAAYTAAALRAMLDLVAKDQVNLEAMLTWAFEFDNAHPFQGLRTLSTHGIDKPILNLFRMLGLMHGDRVLATTSSSIPVEQLLRSGTASQPDIDALATRATNSAAVLLWNYNDADLPAALAQSTASTQPAQPLQITITGIPQGVRRVLLERDSIDSTHSNAYTAWQRMGSPDAPTTAQYEALKAAGQLQSDASPAWLDVTNGKLSLATTLPPQSLALLRITW